MYSYDWQQYFKALENKIKQMENQMKELETQIYSIQERPMTNIEKIEYNFDQLKIESLEGTLNIGLSPDGLSSEELSIPNPNNQQQGTNPPRSQPLVQDIMQELQGYFNQTLPTKINQFAQETEKSFPPGFQNMIMQDVYKQLPDRIQHYIRLHSENNNGMLNKETKQQIMEDVKKEITHSVKKFIDGNEGGTTR
ncbi:spore germination protein GerPC [Salinibacillus xinjiangensis]|uniref:Uncharacterized protein n=1 Tax=Salinibacillus xinjiangensis TaxID=1229268 RepID=A0A6G1X7W8_9BACI|nr:spore germination protein GerPC [Salinibacillus xinjiangensis]MRG87037.1 hypothetical protein [Salinibacillus xinjiangensis]